MSCSQPCTQRVSVCLQPIRTACITKRDHCPDQPSEHRIYIICVHRQQLNTLFIVRLAEAIEIRGLLRRNTEELTGVMRALSGEYILPEAGGDLLRDGPGVLPTGVSSFMFGTLRS